MNNEAQINFYLGKLGQEQKIADMTFGELGELSPPCKGELICIDEEVYRVINVMQNYDIQEYAVFLEMYDWEG